MLNRLNQNFITYVRCGSTFRKVRSEFGSSLYVCIRGAHPETESVPRQSTQPKQRRGSGGPTFLCADGPPGGRERGEGDRSTAWAAAVAARLLSLLGHAGRAVAVCEPKWSRWSKWTPSAGPPTRTRGAGPGCSGRSTSTSPTSPIRCTRAKVGEIERKYSQLEKNIAYECVGGARIFDASATRVLNFHRGHFLR